MRTTIRTSGATIAALAFLLMSPGAMASDEADASSPSNALAAAAQPAGPVIDPIFGAIVSDGELAAQRGGADLHVNENSARAAVQDNIASNLTTGNNTISDSAFSNANGVPMVVQNSGNNVIIQNSTILNLQLK
jgi:hypothetical protein